MVHRKRKSSEQKTSVPKKCPFLGTLKPFDPNTITNKNEEMESLDPYIIVKKERTEPPNPNLEERDTNGSQSAVNCSPERNQDVFGSKPDLQRVKAEFDDMGFMKIEFDESDFYNRVESEDGEGSSYYLAKTNDGLGRTQADKEILQEEITEDKKDFPLLENNQVACSSRTESERGETNGNKSKEFTDRMEESDDQIKERCFKEMNKTDQSRGRDSSCLGEEDEMSVDYNNEDTRDAAHDSDNYQGRGSSSTGEEVMALREFDVLDEFDQNEEDDEQDDYSSDFDSDVPDEEIEAMLEEGLRQKTSNNGETEDNNELPYKERKKIVLEELNPNHFEMLPDGWVQVNHNSGMPIFLHKQSRVCTLSKPYFLGPGSARKHEIPLSAIPCLQYRRALESKTAVAKENEEKEVKEEEKKTEEVNPIASAGFPNASIETIQENKAQQSLSAAQIRDYCEKLFQFKTVKVLRFKSWSERRKYTKQRKQEKQLQRPTLPEGTKLIKFPIQNSGCREGGHPKKEWIMNPNGKSYVCILHEYVQHALKKQPTYKFKELENAGTPYSATVSINDMQYGVGFGTSKKQAKSEAAKATLEILIPEMKEKIQANEKGGSRAAHSSSDSYLSIFDEIKIEDPRVAELCAKTTEPSPYAILLTCLQRNFGSGEMNIKYEVNTLRHQRNEFMMSVGRHTARVVCKNKRDGKQRASQSILQALHPHITSWGSLLRLYGSRSVKSMKEKKQEEQEITLLQSKAAINSPNIAILNKLKTEMMKIRDRRASVQPIGKFIPPDDVDLPSSSGADLNNVVL